MRSAPRKTNSLETTKSQRHESRRHPPANKRAGVVPAAMAPPEPPPYARQPRYERAQLLRRGPGDSGWRDGIFWFDGAAAGKAVRFIETCLVHVKGEWAGRPLLLAPWQKDIVGALFGWKRPDGTRRFRKVFLYVPRKNGKTVLLAAILLTLFYVDGEPGAEVYNVAGDRAQAKICFNMAKRMVESSPLLRQRTEIWKSSMDVPATGSTFQALSSDAPGKHGTNPHAVGFDELHVQKDDQLYEAVTTGDVARRQPVILFATTADVLRKSVCNSEYDYAVNVRDGVVDDPYYLPVIYECPKDSDGHYLDWKLESTWRAANPNYGVSVKPERLRAAIQRAIEDPSKENQVKRLNLNIRTEQVTRWLGSERWNACASALGLAEFAASLRTKKCLGGLDLGDKFDLNTLCLVFPPVDSAPEGAEPGKYRAIWRHWIPVETLLDRKARPYARYYETWSRGCICRTAASAAARIADCPAILHLTPGNVTDYEFIRGDINALASVYDIEEIAVDPHQALHLMTLLAQDGLTVFEHFQSCAKMHPGITELERLLLGGLFEHGGDPVAAWAFRNVIVYENAYGEKRFDKRKAAEKMDPLVALVMPIGRAALLAESATPSMMLL
jgi:phage terminase large subunit-like protein